jgi:hypothetical protein
MKTGRSLQELAAELERQNGSKQDFIADTRKIEMLEDKTLEISGAGVQQVTLQAHRQIGERVGIPAKYYDKMAASSPRLLAENVNHWFYNNPEKRMIRTMDGNVRAFLSDSYRPLDNYELAQSILPILSDMKAEVQSCEVTDNRMYLKCVTPRLTESVDVGDEVQAGICISNSEIGLGSLKVEPLIYRLICRNGMVVNDLAYRKNHVGRGHNLAGINFEVSEYFRTETRIADDKAFFMKIQDIVRAAVDEVNFHKFVDKLRDATKRHITEDVPQVIENVKKTFLLGDGEGGGVLKHLIEGGSLTQYGLANAITKFAQGVESYDRSTELERLGATVVALPNQKWNSLAGA